MVTFLSVHHSQSSYHSTLCRLNYADEKAPLNTQQLVTIIYLTSGKAEALCDMS